MQDRLNKWAAEEGFRFLGVVDLDVQEAYAHFTEWLESGWHGDMHYLERHQKLRQAPDTLLLGAKSAIVLGLPYDQGDTFQTVMASDSPRVAQYARFDDYHRLFRKKADRIAKRLHAFLSTEEAAVYRVLVDSAPLLERALAAKTSKGFVGKNTCYIHPDEGSLLLLGEILTTHPLSIDKKEPVDPHIHGKQGGCGACRECQRHCPTGALDRDYKMDARKCLAYWTIENRGIIPEKFWPWLRYYYFGCDLCQLVCPYNMRAQASTLPETFKARPTPPLFEVATMDQKKYEAYFGGTSATRAKRNGLRRNALIAMAVMNHSDLPKAMRLAALDAGSPIAETLQQIRKYCRL